MVLSLEALDDVAGSLSTEELAESFLSAQRGVEGEKAAVDEAIASTENYSDALLAYIEIKRQQNAVETETAAGAAAADAAREASLEVQKQAAEDRKAAAEEEAVALEEARQNILDMNDDIAASGLAFDQAAERAAAMERAFERINIGSALTQGQEVNTFVDSLGGVVEALDELGTRKINNEDFVLLPPPDDWQAWLNMPDEAQGVIDALAGFRDQIQSELGQAFEAGGAQGAIAWADNTRVAVTDALNEMGITSETAINQILTALGILDDQQVQLQIDASEAELARTKLEVLQGVMDQLANQGVISPQVVMEIAGLALTDPEAALAQATALLEGLGIDVPASLELDPAQAAQATADAAAAAGEGTTVDLDTTADPSGARTDLRPLSNSANNPVAYVYTIAETTDAKAAIDNAAMPGGVARTATIDSDVIGLAADIVRLDDAAADRIAEFFALLNEGSRQYVDSALDNVARDRNAQIRVVTTNRTINTPPVTSGGGTFAFTPEAAAVTPFAGETVGINPLVEPATSVVTYGTPVSMAGPVASPTIHNHVTISAAVIGSRFDVQRAVTKALKQSYRLSGSRV